MAKKNLFLGFVFALTIFSFQSTVWAEEELSFDDSFESETPVVDPATPTTTTSTQNPTETTQELSLEDELSSSTATATSAEAISELEQARREAALYKKSAKNNLILESLPPLADVGSDSDTENVNLATPFEMKKNEAALFGWSYGALVTSQPMYLNYVRKAIFVDQTDTFNQQTDPVQTAGVFFRYAIVPYVGMGADFNISHSMSLNHANVTFNQTDTLKQFYITKVEMNLSYALSMGRILPIYFLAGIGFQKVSSGNIQDILNQNGYGGQIGAGFALAGTLNLEALYMYYEHRLSNKLVDQIRGLSASNSTAAYNVDSAARVSTRGISARLTYSSRF